MPSKPKVVARKAATNEKSTKPPKLANLGNTAAETSSGLSQEAEDQFELELCWCIQQLEMCLTTGKLSEKQTHDLTKNINILKSNTAPLVKKRQIMRNTLGNYREKMTVDEQKYGKAACSIKFVPPSSQNKKYLFLRKAASMGKRKGEEGKHSNLCPVNSENEKSVDTDIQNIFKFNFHIKE
ncbi:hypothetical protein K0M31_017221 [Melipona bicolor]|uniref:Uncharacterized protein n=1 Tax=Melipona bicolor TaxID=60889 RepID=A0AA40KSG5_9HYME|nr:hypothetical protein K0M31_017221 [Melipona bicolor]